MKKYTLELFIVFAVILYLLLYLFSSYVSSNPKTRCKTAAKKVQRTSLHIVLQYLCVWYFQSFTQIFIPYRSRPKLRACYGEDDFSSTLNSMVESFSSLSPHDPRPWSYLVKVAVFQFLTLSMRKCLSWCLALGLGRLWLRSLSCSPTPSCSSWSPPASVLQKVPSEGL